MKRVLLGLAAALILAAPAQADVYTVDGDADTSGPCTGTACPSLRAAVNAANDNPGADTIVALHGLYQLTDGPLAITDAVTLQGDVEPGTIRASSGGGRVVEIANASVAINDLWLEGGSAEFGGSLLAQNSTVELNRVRVSGGSAEYGGGIANRNGVMTINESVIDGNTATQGDGAGGGIINYGVGGAAWLTISHSTIADNVAKSGGGLVSVGFGNAVNTTGTTIAHNRSSDGAGGVHIADGKWSPDLTLVGDNVREPATPSNCTGSAASSNGGNVESFNDCGFQHATDRREVVDVRLAATLTDNGGPTPTLALQPGSPALNAVRGGCGGFDQRHVPRPQGVGCDAGAFESDLSLTITDPANGLYTGALERQFRGTADPNVSVELYLETALVATTTADASGDWAVNVVLPSTDGDYTYVAEAPSTPPVSAQLFIDRQRPDTTIDSQPTNPSNQTTATFTYSSSEPEGAQFGCRFFGPGHPDTTYGPCSPGGETYTDLAPGQYTFGVQAVDRAGNNDATPAEYTFVVGAPTITSPAANFRTNAATLSFAGTAGPDETVDLWRDGSSVRTGSANAQGQWTLANVPLPVLDGEFEFRIIAGGFSSTVRVIVDRTPPQAAIVARPPAVTNRTEVAFTYGANEPGTFTCRLAGPGRDDNEVACPAAGTSYTGLADGAYQFHVRARDQAGNDSTATHAFTVNRALIAGPDVAVAGTEPTAATLAFSTVQTDRTLTCRLEGPARDPVFTTCVSPQRYDGLVPGAYRFTVRSTDSLGNFADAAREFTIAGPVVEPQPTPTPTATPVPEPTLDEDVVATPIGKVLVRLKGTTRFVELTAGEVPLGAEIDARSGRVRLRFETAKGKVQTGTFRGGMFTVTQVGKILDLKLTEALAACPKKKSGKASAAQSKKKPRKRSLWGDGKGSFRTTGKFSAATVRGTKWLVEDSCAGTLTRVTSGVVSVKDRKKTVLVRAGKRYLAKAR